MKRILFTLMLISTLGVEAKTGKLIETKTNKIDVVIVEQKSKKVLVGYERYFDKPIFIEIRNSRGKIVHKSGKLKDNIKLIRYDVSNLPDDTYTYRIITEDYEIEKAIKK